MKKQNRITSERQEKRKEEREKTIKAKYNS